MKRDAWRRVLWGVELNDKDDIRPILLGSGWHENCLLSNYDGEPPRALLFCTRKLAREWCAARMERPKDFDWRFRAVKVIETLRYAR